MTPHDYLLDQKQKTVWSENESPSIKTYTLANFRELPQIKKMSKLGAMSDKNIQKTPHKAKLNIRDKKNS